MQKWKRLGDSGKIIGTDGCCIYGPYGGKWLLRFPPCDIKFKSQIDAKRFHEHVTKLARAWGAS